MREHMGLFRGKRTDNGEWVTGYYCRAEHHWHNRGIHKDWIIESASANGGWFALHNKYPVISDTVGECTGLRDKNGKLIFEGAWVEIRYCDHTGEEYVSRRTVSYNPEHGRWYPLCWGEECDFCDAYTEITSIEVIDNPELMKGGEGDV